jgi:putative ABC transport system permease protein
MIGSSALAWRGLRARPLRTTLTTVGVALGVAVLFAGIATNAGIDASVDGTVSRTMGRADLRIAAFDETGLTEQTLESIATTAGVDIVAPTIERATYLGLPISGPADALPAPVTVVGVDVTSESVLHELGLQRGVLPGAHELGAVISASLARDDGLALGDRVTIQGPDAPAVVPVVGILTGDGPWDDRAGRIVLLPFDLARTTFDSPGIERIDIGLADGVDADGVVAALEASLLTEPYLLSTPTELAATMRASTGDFATMTALIAAVALFAGAFLIFNTLSMTVVERVRELGLLRAAGATRRQVTGFILVQALAIGVIGTIVGLGVGAILSVLVARWVGQVGDVTLARPEISPISAIAAAVTGLVVTVAAALEPARRAGRIPPVEALKARLDPPTARRARLRWLVVVFLIVGAMGLVAWPRPTGDGAMVRAIAVYVTLLVVALGVPLFLPWLVRLAGVPFTFIVRLEERLARASLLHDRGRASLTIGALTVGLAMMVALGGVAQAARSTAGAWIADVVPGDLVLTSIFPRSLDEGLDGVLGGLPGVQAVSPIATFDLSIDGQRIDGAAMTGSDLAANAHLDLTDGDPSDAYAALDRGGAVIVPIGLARQEGIELDDLLRATGSDGSSVELRVAAIAERTLPGRTAESAIVGWPDAARLGVVGADAFAITFDAGATDEQRAGIEREARGLALEPVTMAEIQGAVGLTFDRVFGLFDALALIAVIVAALGIVNTLSMNVFERVREIGVLRAAGMTRRQVWRVVVVEAGVTGTIGAIGGILAGIVIGSVMVTFTGDRPGFAVAISWSAVVLALALGVGLAMLAAAYPARLASRLSIVRALGHE